MLKNFLKQIKQLAIGDFSPDIALRYLPVIDILKKRGLIGRQILEVGSGALGITPYLKSNITGLDIEFGIPVSPWVKKIKYQGGHFPEDINEFDLVLSVDSLEHIRPEARQATLDEMIRVAGQAVVIVVPCGQKAAKHDRDLAGYFKSIHGRSDKFFVDHLANGLPEARDIENMLNSAAAKAGKKIKIETNKLLNLNLRGLYMKCAIHPGILPSILYYCFLSLLPFRNFLNFGHCYRKLFFVSIE